MNQRSLFTILGVSLAILSAMVAWLVKLGHDETLRSSQEQANNFVQAFHGQVLSTLRRAQANVELIAERLPEKALTLQAVPQQRGQIEGMLRSHLRNFPELSAYFIWDGEGRLLYGTMGALPSRKLPNVAKQPAFQQLRNDAHLPMVFSEVIRSSVTDRLSLGIGIPIRDAKGHLLAVVTGVIWLEQLAHDVDRLQMPERSVIGIRRSDDHKLVFRKPMLENELNKPVLNAIQRRIDAGEVSGQDRFQASTDGGPRSYAFRWLQPYPFYVVVGIAEDTALDEWRKNTVIVASMLAILGLALAILLWRATCFNAQRNAALEDAQATHEVLKEAIDNMSAGLVIYDPSDRLVMCNRAHRNLVNIIDDTLVEGRTFEEIIREGVRRGLYPHESSSEEEWLERRRALHRQADGRPYEMELSEGRWIQVSEHRTPKGYLVGSRIDITERKRLEVELREQASTDVLTGLSNRRYFLTRLEQELERVRRQTTREAMVLMLDLDHFKRINDLYGHATGDGVLRHFSEILRGELRTIDTAGRLGGEEFAVILPGSSRQAAHACAQRICDRVASRPLKFAGHEVIITVSVGVSALLPEDLTSDAVLTRADRALYQAKEAGRNRVESAPD